MGLSLGEALTPEIKRAQVILSHYEEIGGPGLFAAAMIRLALARAIKAQMEGDIVGMILAYNDLKEIDD